MSFFNHKSGAIGGLFSAGESFRLCTEGLQALERYEREPSGHQLDLAQQRLQECVRRYPADLIPKFYLGSVKTLAGYAGLEDAEQLLTEVVERGSGDLRLAAQYNLAVAHIERYDSAGFDRADRILRDLAGDLTSGTPQRRRMAWSARANQFYIQAHRLWSLRAREPLEKDATRQAAALREALLAFKSELDRSEFNADADINADCWNDLGTLSEAQAYFEPDRQDDFARQAEQAYRKALEYKRDWIDAKSNLARLYQEVFKNAETARQLWEEVLRVRPDDDYAHYNLGLLDLAKGDPAEARKHFEKAPNIPEARAALDRLNG